MSEMKMKDVFELPLKITKFEQYGKTNCYEIIQSKITTVYNPETVCNSLKELKSIVHAVNTHDELVSRLKAKDKVIEVAVKALDYLSEWKVKDRSIDGKNEGFGTDAQEALSQIQALETPEGEKS